jgi:hypothetical protein
MFGGTFTSVAMTVLANPPLEPIVKLQMIEIFSGNGSAAPRYVQVDDGRKLINRDPSTTVLIKSCYYAWKFA